MLEFTDIIQNMAFPIAVSGILFKMLMDEKESHKNESLNFIQALNNNTKAIERIIDMFEQLNNYTIKKEEREAIWKEKE